MTSPFQHLKAVVFDWAGTTVDHGSRAPALVFREIFRRRGIEITMAQARGPMGLAKQDHIAAVLQLPDVSSRWQEQFGQPFGDADIDAMYEQFLPLQKETLARHCDVIPGVVEAVNECRRRGLRIGSTTGYTHALVEAFAVQVAAAGYAPDCTVCSDDVDRGRPAPWMLLEAAKQLDAFPLSHVVKVDDTTPGIEAARNAGCWAIGVTRTGNEVGLDIDEVAALSDEERRQIIESAAQKLRDAGAQYVIESVADIMPTLEEIDATFETGQSG